MSRQTCNTCGLGPAYTSNLEVCISCWGYDKWQPKEENRILKNVQRILTEQTEKGLKKYGKTVDPADYSTVEWIEHAQQECVDKLVYLEVLKERLLDEMGTSK
jgi:hypothetical protein